MRNFIKTAMVKSFYNSHLAVRYRGRLELGEGRDKSDCGGDYVNVLHIQVSTHPSTYFSNTFYLNDIFLW